MKKLVILAALLAAAPAFAADYVRGYMRSNGTYVAPHYRSSPDSSMFNNYSTQGNVNPYTGQAGTVNPYATRRQPLSMPIAPIDYNSAFGR